MKIRKPKIKIIIALSMLVLMLSLSIFVFFRTKYFKADINQSIVYYYLSPSGDDNNAGTIDAPFATLEKARDTVRATKTSMGNSFAGATIYLRGGEFNRITTFTLSASDSGTANAPINYKAYQDEKPIIRGSQTITGFAPSPDNPNILQADLAAQGLGDLVIKDVYLNDERQVLARTPNYVTPDFSQTDPYAGTWNFASLENDCATVPIDNRVRKTTLIYNQADISDPNLNAINQSLILSPANPAQMELFANTEYWNNIINLASVDTDNHQLVLASNASYDICAKNRYLLQNYYAALDAGREWYQDRTNNLLYYMPPQALTGSDRISVPVVVDAINLNSVIYTNFTGLTFEEFGNNLIISNGASNISILKNTFRSSRGQGVALFASSHDFNINWNLLYNLGSCGIQIYHNSNGTQYVQNLTSDNIKIQNNTIHDVAQVINSTNAITTYYSVGTVIGHNEIYNLPRLAIGISGNDNIIEYNKIYKVNLLTKDSGGIYLGARSWIQRGNIIRNNYIKDTGGYGKTPWGTGDGTYKLGNSTSGIYLDDYSSGDFVYNNIVVNAEWGCFQNHLGRDNSYANNICIEGGLETPAVYGQMSFNEDTMVDPSTNPWIITMWDELQNMTANGYDRDKYFARYPELANVVAPAETKQGEIMVNNKVKNNIFYYPSGPNPRAYNTYNLGTNQEIDRNIYWPGARTITVSRSLTGTSSVSTWAGWQNLGFDVHSIVANPLFNDANVGIDGSMDFSLLSNSPALSLGFNPIDTSRIGPAVPAISINAPRQFTYKSKPVLSGTKSSEVTKIVINGLTNDVAEGQTTWSLELELPVGQSSINVLGKDQDAISSTAGSASITRRKTADADNDGFVGIVDFSSLMSSWSKQETNNIADFNEDDSVGITDFGMMMSNWGG